MFIKIIPGVVFLWVCFYVLPFTLARILFIFIFGYLGILWLLFPFINRVTKEQGKNSYKKTQYVIEMIQSIFVTIILKTNFFTFNRATEQLEKETHNRYITFFFSKSVPSLAYTLGLMTLCPFTLFFLRHVSNKVAMYMEFSKIILVMFEIIWMMII